VRVVGFIGINLTSDETTGDRAGQKVRVPETRIYLIYAIYRRGFMGKQIGQSTQRNVVVFVAIAIAVHG